MHFVSKCIQRLTKLNLGWYKQQNCTMAEVRDSYHPYLNLRGSCMASAFVCGMGIERGSSGRRETAAPLHPLNVPREVA